MDYLEGEGGTYTYYGSIMEKMQIRKWQSKQEFEATAGKFDIVKGVRQGCILSHLLFNIYSEKIMTEALGKWKGGIGTGGSGKQFDIRG